MTAGQTSSFELLEKVQPGGCLFYDVVNMGRPSKGRKTCTVTIYTPSYTPDSLMISLAYGPALSPNYSPFKNLFPEIVIIGGMVIVWRLRGKIIRSVLCNNFAQCNAHTYEQTYSSLDWVLSHWAQFTVLRFIFVYVLLHACVVL